LRKSSIKQYIARVLSHILSLLLCFCLVNKILGGDFSVFKYQTYNWQLGLFSLGLTAKKGAIVRFYAPVSMFTMSNNTQIFCANNSRANGFSIKFVLCQKENQVSYILQVQKFSF
jgi:hypothetical protein